jgi:hypothetical protein
MRRNRPGSAIFAAGEDLTDLKNAHLSEEMSVLKFSLRNQNAIGAPESYVGTV